jgi:hypothetical protein
LCYESIDFCFSMDNFAVSRVAELLLAGTVMNRVFQPHETHIPYVLQVNKFIAIGIQC